MQERGLDVMLLRCPDRPGIVADLAGFMGQRGLNIVDLDGHVDRVGGVFYARVVWEYPGAGAVDGANGVAGSGGDGENGFEALVEATRTELGHLLETMGGIWLIDGLERPIPAAMFVSKADHGAHDLLWRYGRGEFAMDLKAVLGNHRDLEGLAQQYGIPFYYFPVKKGDAEAKAAVEQEELALLGELGVDLVILARYMQVLSEDFVAAYPSKIINIHHSFLPAFKGGNPYKQAFQRGVKIIGATSHYVTADLDEGPIITQDVALVSHRDTVKDLIHRGRDLERVVLSRAVAAHCERRVIVDGVKTVVF